MAGLARRQVQRVQSHCILLLETRNSSRPLRRHLPHRMAVSHYTALIASTQARWHASWRIFREGKLFPWSHTHRLPYIRARLTHLGAEWEPRPTSPSSIRLIHFGRMLEDNTPLKGTSSGRLCYLLSRRRVQSLAGLFVVCVRG